MIPTEQDLMQMKELTRMMGTLTNVQKQQLQMWPKVILGANKVELEFDPEDCVLTVDVSNLDYQSMIEGQTEDPVTIYKRRMAKFNTAVKWLLGEEYAVVVKLNGNVLQSFPPTAAATLAHPPRLSRKKKDE